MNENVTSMFLFNSCNVFSYLKLNDIVSVIQAKQMQVVSTKLSQQKYKKMMIQLASIRRENISYLPYLYQSNIHMVTKKIHIDNRRQLMKHQTISFKVQLPQWHVTVTLMANLRKYIN
jgi:hypothetical protein